MGEQNLALQFQYIVTLANSNKASMKKSSAHHNFRDGGLPSLVLISFARIPRVAMEASGRRWVQASSSKLSLRGLAAAYRILAGMLR